jgi:hypothetical protein
MKKQQFKITGTALETVIKLYLIKNPFLTPARLYALWKCDKLKMLRDYKLWRKDEFMRLFEEKNDETK